MDSGIFLRSRATVAGWIAGPLLLMCLVHQGTRLHCQAIEDRLEHERAMMEIIPDLLTGLHRARASRNRFAVNTDRPASTANVGAFLTESSDHHGFQLESVQIAEQPEKPGKEAPRLSVQVEGRGTLPAMMRFLETLQQPSFLVSVESANVQLVASPAADPSYQGRFVLHYWKLAPSPPP